MSPRDSKVAAGSENVKPSVRVMRKEFYPLPKKVHVSNSDPPH